MLLTGLISALCICSVVSHDMGNMFNSPGDLEAEIDGLAADVLSLETSLDQIEKLEHKEGLKLRVLNKHIRDSEGSSCPEPWFQLQCRASRRCIPQYLVCDGIKHCPDGQDEEECDIEDYVTVGEIFEGTLVMSDCAEGPIDYAVGQVQSINKDDLFPNLSTYTVSYINLASTTNEFGAVLMLEEEWLPAAHCGYNNWAGLHQMREFDLVDHSLIIQSGYRMGNGELCMKWILKRRTSDEPYPWYGYFD